MTDRKNDLYLFSYYDTIAQDEDPTSSRAVPQIQAQVSKKRGIHKDDTL